MKDKLLWLLSGFGIMGAVFVGMLLKRKPVYVPPVEVKPKIVPDDLNEVKKELRKRGLTRSPE